MTAPHFERHNGLNFRVPDDLEVTPTTIKRILLVGQCILNAWAFELPNQERGMSVEHVLFNFSTELPDRPEHAIDQYDFQIVAIPLRSILHESKFLRLSYLDDKAVERLFSEACEQMALFLRTAMKWNREHSILSFVTGFLVPQQNPNGRLFPRYDLRNLMHFVERLNERLAEEVSRYTNAYFLDIDQISASIGRRYVQDDSVLTIAHGSTLANFADDKDKNRIEPPEYPVMTVYNAKIGRFIAEVWRELRGMYRTIRQTDLVKMVIVDLDDTLWRGVLAELDEVSLEAIEGWPLGVIEALAFLRKRGVILAIVSKNEEKQVRRIFEQLLRHRLPLDSFALRRVNWMPKVQNVGEIMQEANLLPRNVVFVDDNPVERASISAVFPDLRTIGADPYSVRRVLLWSPETQVQGVTEESARRGQMIEAQSQREAVRKTLSREEFLQTLQVKLRFVTVSKSTEASFARAFELLNKTNQFNTTGERWTMERISREMDGGLSLLCFHAEDKFTEYGLVGVLLIRDHLIKQLVMSCRVLGLDVEKAVLGHVAALARQAGQHRLQATLRETEANLPCRHVYAESGFAQVGEVWTLDLQPPLAPFPPHIEIIAGAAPAGPAARAVVNFSVTQENLPPGLSAAPESGLKFPTQRLAPGMAYAFNDAAEKSWAGEMRGFGRHESWGIWTVGPRSALSLRLPPETAMLELTLRPFLGREMAARTVIIRVNGLAGAKLRFEGRGGGAVPIRVPIPPNAQAPGGETVLSFDIENPCSPMELGIGDDTRHLGVGLVDLSLMTNLLPR